MIAFVNGTVEVIEENAVVIDTGAIGYRVYMSPYALSTLSAGSSAKIYTYLKVAEDAMDLYGFLTAEEITMFRRIISVSGAGPKAGLAILSVLRPAEFALAVVTNDFKAITRAQAVGPKLAQKIVLELKDKLENSDFIKNADTASAGSVPVTIPSGNNEAVEALCALGYTQSEASRAVSQAEGDNVSDVIRNALKILAKSL
ncbi:MAG: Holliday junction branch migration protein RuvA [Ruminococcaceae bacterium]|nr:Holliday junction branch migration protein RuvA [Oscillospiraceae bacterium]